MNLLFIANREYLNHLKECIQSVIRFPAKDGYAIYILHSDLKKEDQLELLESITQEEVNLYFRNVNPAMFENFPESERYPRLVYYRIFAAKLLPDTLERILYLDSDTIVINPLEDLYNMEFKGNYFLACTHVKKFLNKMNQFRLGIGVICNGYAKTR